MSDIDERDAVFKQGYATGYADALAERDKRIAELEAAEGRVRELELSVKNWRRNWEIASTHETELEEKLRKLNDAADLLAEAVGPYDPPQRGSNLEKLYRLVTAPEAASPAQAELSDSPPVARQDGMFKHVDLEAMYQQDIKNGIRAGMTAPAARLHAERVRGKRAERIVDAVRALRPVPGSGRAGGKG